MMPWPRRTAATVTACTAWPNACAARGTLRAFLRVQAHGRAVDLLRSDGARRARELTDHRRPRSPAAAVEDVALSRLAGDDAWQLLSRLDDGERRAITLAYFGDHSYREVAKLLGLPEGTVKSRIRTGLARLRAGLSADDWQAAQQPNGPTPSTRASAPPG